MIWDTRLSILGRVTDFAMARCATVLPGELAETAPKGWFAFMHAMVIPLLPKNGFTVRRIGDRWELVNSRCYGRTVVLQTWPFDQHGEAFEHCCRLNGRNVEELRAVLR